jgi:hypothetical protein
MKPYLIVYSGAFATRDEMKAFLDAYEDEFAYWTYMFPNSFFVVSRVNAQEISELLEEYFEDRSEQPYFVTEIPENCQGRLTSKAWKMINKPKSFEE